MTRPLAERLVYGLWGAAIGAAAQGVEWTFWVAWAMAWTALWVISRWHRNGGHAHA